MSFSAFSSSHSLWKHSSMSSHSSISNFGSWTKPLATDNENTFFKCWHFSRQRDLRLPKQALLKDLSRNWPWYISFKLFYWYNFSDSRIGKAVRRFWFDVESITYSTSSLPPTSRTFKHWKPSLSNSYTMFFKSFIPFNFKISDFI